MMSPEEVGRILRKALGEGAPYNPRDAETLLKVIDVMIEERIESRGRDIDRVRRLAAYAQALQFTSHRKALAEGGYVGSLATAEAILAQDILITMGKNT